jgi:hypothetical protein
MVLLAAKAFTSVQLFFSGFNSFSTVRRHVVLGHPVFLVPCGFHSSATIHFHIKKLSGQICLAFLQFGFFNHLGFGYVGD